MSRNFKQLTYEDRLKLAELLKQGKRAQDIADILGINVSTVYREKKRGSENSLDGNYDPDYAYSQYQDFLRKKGPKKVVEENPLLAEFISKCILEDKLSPKRIAELLKEDSRFPDVSLSGQSIYYAIETGAIPGVTKDTLMRKTTATMYNDGQIGIHKWMREEYGFSDGDIFDVSIEGDDTIVLRKVKQDEI